MKKNILIAIIFLFISAFVMYLIKAQVIKRDKSASKTCVNEELGNIQISSSNETKSVIMVNTSDFMSKNKPLDVTSLDQLLTKYNKDILLNDPACSQQLLKVDNNGNYIYQDISTDIVFDKCWDKKNLDLDNNGKDEQVIIATIAMTKSPHVAAILKEGKLIFAYEDANIDIEPLEAKDPDKGFYLYVGNVVMQGNKKVKYVFTINGEITPIWQEVYCN